MVSDVEVRAVEHPEPDAGRQALAVLDRVLGEKPTDDTPRPARKQLGDDFSEATRHLCGYRDILIQAQRKGDGDAQSRKRLQDLNGVLSAVLGGHFPLGDIPWPSVEQARDVLARLLDPA